MSKAKTKNVFHLRFMLAVHVAVVMIFIVFGLNDNSLCFAQAPTAAKTTRLSENGKALLPIVIAPGASEKTKAAASTLAQYLEEISGGTFQIQTGDGKSGIAIGVAKDFPALNLAGEFDADDAARSEEYLLRSGAPGVLLIGGSENAVEHAVWDLLHRLGYRQFFPGAHWEVIPKIPSASIAVNVREKPDYLTRRIWFTYGTWPENNARMAAWNARNRMGGLALNSGHAYPAIINANKAEFAGHPEYFAPYKGQNIVPQTKIEIESAKFDISNPGLREIVINHALRYFEKNPEAVSISVDPSDGGGWGESEAEKKLGSVSDRVTLLANEVAAAVGQKFPGRYVGFYAYNMHSPAPTIRVHPHVVVSVATAFISGGFTVDQLIEGWQKQGATIGMREYYSLIHWDKDLPNRAKASRIDSLANSISHYHDKGARFMNAESSDNWGPNGLGYYIAGRVMWDLDEAKNIPAIVEDFLDKSFGPAKEPMREFYGLINGIGNAPSRPLSEDYVGRMYRALDAAYKKTDDQHTRSRLDDLSLYARYVELYLEYSSAQKEDRQENYQELIRFSYRIRDTHMLHSLAIYRTGLRDKSVTIPAEANWQISAADKAGKPLNPWKQSTSFTPEEVQELVRSGVEKNKLLDFEPKSWSANLALPQGLNFTPVARADFASWRGTQEYFIWMREPGPIRFTARAGLYYTTRGAAHAQLFSAGEVEADVEAGEGEEDDAAPIAPVALAELDIPPTNTEAEYSLNAPRAGLYRLRVTDRMMGTLVRLPSGLPVAVRSALSATPGFTGRWKLYFYVPKNTKAVGGFAYGRGLVSSGDGKIVFDFPAKDGYFSIPVPAGQDGRLWTFEAANGHIGLMTVPPYLVRSENEMLLPQEVVEADGGR